MQCLSTVAIIHFVLTLTFTNAASTDFTSEEYLSARHWTHSSLLFSEGKQSEKSNVADEGTREGQSSQSLGHSQYGSLWCNRDAEAPCFCEPSVNASQPSNKPSSSPPSLPCSFQLSRRQLDSLSPHILCLICQPKPSGPTGENDGDGSPTSLFSHCISTPADINHGGSTLAHPTANATGRGFRLIPVHGKHRPRETATDFLLQFPLFGCPLRPAVRRSPIISARSLPACDSWPAEFSRFLYNAKKRERWKIGVISFMDFFRGETWFLNCFVHESPNAFPCFFFFTITRLSLNPSSCNMVRVLLM